jgi:hypothetical protein
LTPEPSRLGTTDEELPGIEGPEAEIRPPAGGPGENLAVAAVVVALGVAAVAGALGLGAGSPSRPGPGTWPLLVGGVLLCLGLALVANVRRTEDAERFTGSALLVLAGIATMVAFVAAVGRIGFEIPAALLAFVWLRFLGRESWRTSVILSLATVAVCYLLFVGALAVPIPHLF